MRIPGCTPTWWCIDVYMYTHAVFQSIMFFLHTIVVYLFFVFVSQFQKVNMSSMEAFGDPKKSKFDQLNGGAWAMGRLWGCT